MFVLVKDLNLIEKAVYCNGLQYKLSTLINICFWKKLTSIKCLII